MNIATNDLKEVLKALDEVGLSVHYKNDPASLTLNSGALQGPIQGNTNLGGLFSAPGVRPDRYSAMSEPRSLARLLQPEPSDIFNEILSIVTGATAGSGENAANFCGNPPQPGDLKQCEQTYQFGKWFSKTPLQSVNDIGYLRNRADIPGRILNSPPRDNPLIPETMWQITDTRSQAQYQMYMEGVELRRQLEQVLITGDATKAYTSTQRGFIREFNGLDLLIKTGYADTGGTLCPAADSMVIDYNNSLIGNTIGGGDGRTITQTISDLVYAQKDIAFTTGFEGLQSGFVGREEVFRALTDVYANTYATSRFQSNSLTAGTPLVQDATFTNNLRLEMLQGHYLLVEGMPIPWISSDGMPFEGQGNNVYKTDIFLVPLSWSGGRLLRLEYFNLGNQYIQEWNGLVNPNKRQVINNGLYAMGYRDNGFCDEILFASVLRLILETPFLAGRIDNVQFSYVAPTRNAIPGQSLYVDGGISYYTPRAV